MSEKPGVEISSALHDAAKLAAARRALEADDDAIAALMTGHPVRGLEVGEALSRSESQRKQWLVGDAGRGVLAEIAELKRQLDNARQDVNQVCGRRDLALRELRTVAGLLVEVEKYLVAGVNYRKGGSAVAVVNRIREARRKGLIP